MIIILQQDMEVYRIQALVKVGRQIIYMTLPETVGNLHKKRTAPATELSEGALSTMALTIRLLTVASAILPTPVATMVLALLYI